MVRGDEEVDRIMIRMCSCQSASYFNNVYTELLLGVWIKGTVTDGPLSEHLYNNVM